LKKFPKSVHIDINPTVTPSFQRHHAILHHNLAIFRYKVDGIVEQNVVKKAEPLAWCSASFVELK
jgi:hypothetical protein